MQKQNKISDWINHQLAIGKYSFPLSYLRSCMPEKSELAIKQALQRLADKNKIISIFRGFYIIIPPAYANIGILPPALFMDDLMQYLNRPYYLSLLSAAALHGAAHQQPQTHYVCTVLPSMRSTNNNGIYINYLCRRTFPDTNIIQKKTESGYVNVSDPILTCLDLISFQKTVGGINRVATVINELSEEVNEHHLSSNIISLTSIANIQRLGYLWEYECEQPELSNILFNKINRTVTNLKTYKLNLALSTNLQSSRNRWKINVNTKIEIDE